MGDAMIIERELTPEHAEEIRNINNNMIISTWTPADIEAELTSRETELNLRASQNFVVPEIAWRHVLIPPTQAKDADGYPVNFDPKQLQGQVRLRRDRFFNMCRAMRAQAILLKCENKTSFDVNSNEMTIANRISRLIRLWRNMGDQFNGWIDNFCVYNYPTNADYVELCPEIDDKKTSYQELLLFLLAEAYKLGYRRYKDHCCTQILSNGHTTRAWKPVMEIKDFVYDATQKETQYEMWKNLTSKGNLVSDVIKHLTACKDYQFPEIKKNRNVWSFSNGLLVGKNWCSEKNQYVIKFYEYKSQDFANLDGTIVSAKYFNQEFNPYEEIDDWYHIPTPHMQKIMDYQNFPEDVSRWLYVFCGRLCFDVNDLDGWQVIPFLKGIARSGKSTIITKVCKKFYETEDVKTLSNNIEKKFGLDSIHDGFMFISPEVKGDLALEQAEFQSLVSGEDLSIARKFKAAKSMQWKTPGILAGNEVPNWKDNSGSVLRRLATWNMTKQVMEADPHLDQKLDAEIPAILCKCVRAYLDYAAKYSDKDIWNVLPAYFKSVQSQVAMVTNSLQHFLASEKVEYGPDKFCPQRLFVQIFNQHCQENNLGRWRFNPDFYAGPFSSRELEVRTDTRTYNNQAYCAQPFIFGVDIVSANNIVDTY
jgi:Family of unknown function (DUF5906)